MLAYGIDVDGSSVRFELFRPVELMHHCGQAESRLSTRSPLTRRTVAAPPMPAARPERFSVALTGGQSIAPYRSGHVAMLQTICSVVAIERMLRPADERDISEFEMRDKKWDRRVRLQQVLAARRPFWTFLKKSAADFFVIYFDQWLDFGADDAFCGL